MFLLFIMSFETKVKERYSQDIQYIERDLVIL